MADQEIVSCPGCGKRYSVPPGVPPGQFQCQDCSATVAYGGEGGGGDEGAAGPSLAPSGRKAGRAARARKKARGRAAARETEEEPAGRRRTAVPAKKGGDPTPYVLAIAAVGILGLIGLVVMKKDKANGGPGTETASGAGGGGGGGRLSSDDLSGGRLGGEEPAAKPADAPAPEPSGEAGGDGERDDLSLGPKARPKPGTGKNPEEDVDARKYESVEQPPTGGNYGKTVDELRSMLRKDSSSVMTDLPHLPDTPPDVAAEIDRLVKVMKDPDAGREVFEAREKLIKIGRPAIPKLLGAVSGLEFPDTAPIVDHVPACLVADQVDIAMREITGYTKFSPLQFSPQGSLRRYRLVLENWMVYWLSTLYDRKYFPKDFEKGDGGGEEEL